jgi:hypothetical protein
MMSLWFLSDRPSASQKNKKKHKKSFVSENKWKILRFMGSIRVCVGIALGLISHAA